MGKKISKRTKKFAKSGNLKKVIDSRRKHQKDVKGIKINKERKAAKERTKPKDEGPAQDPNDSDEEMPANSKFKGMTVDDFLQGDFMNDDDAQDAGEGGSGDEDDDDDSASFASVDEFDNEEQKHIMELSELAKKDPEFYKYLQENDQDLLQFATTQGADEDTGDQEEGSSSRVLKEEIIKQWQAAILQTQSIRALRNLLLAFRSAANMNEDDKGGDAWVIDNPATFNKVVITALKFTPIALKHHLPYKELPDGRFKTPATNAKQAALVKLVASFFSSIVRLSSQLTDSDMNVLIINESTKLLPYVTTNRRSIKAYLKMCLELWCTAQDRVRIAAYLALRRMGMCTDGSLLDMVLKATYLTLVRSTKDSNDRTLPSLNLMKNTASELYSLNPITSYQHGFGYIRQLAMHLRNSMKVKTQDSLRFVYNWQFVHCVDFWCMVLAKSYDTEVQSSTQGESDLKPLVYPLVQVTVGALRLNTASRHYPLHCHLIRSLLHLVRHTKTYIPLAPFILPILTTTLAPSSKSTGSTLKPLDVTTHIRVPTNYLKTRVLNESILEEVTFLLGEWCESVQGSIAFPELMIPITSILKRALKKCKGSKGVMNVKVLVERIEDGCKWSETQRSQVRFAPGDGRQVQSWEDGVNLSETPIGKWVKVQRKARAHKAEMKAKASVGEGTMIGDNNDGREEDDDDQGGSSDSA
ncbi:Nucleolar Complex 2 protein [Tulasnella sp. JGI-2019a]|nr:Nucleolar Complex 2 protein [Tulasnella sp. JGI-2019a]